MKQIKFISNLLLVLLVVIVCEACSSDNPESLTLDKNQSDKLILNANSDEGSISFYAPDAWYAYVDSQVRSSDDIDWLHLETTGGPEGYATITFTIEINNTGESRTAYIIIVCDGSTITITVTQSYEEDLGDDGDDQIDSNPVYYSNMRSVFPSFLPENIDGNRITIDSEGFVTEITGNDGNLKINYDKFGPQAIAQSSYGYTYRLRRGAEYQFCDYIVKYDGDEIVTSYDLEYTAGYLTKVTEYKNNEVYETSELTWNDEDITEVKTTYKGGYSITTFEYDNNPNRTNLMLYDSMMWIDLDEMEFFYFCGLLGFSTQHLIVGSTSIEYEDGEEYKFSATYEYTYNAKYCPIKMVQTETEEGSGKSVTIYDFEWREI